MPYSNIRDYLDDHHIRYTRISHSPAYTAQQVAATAHIPGKEVAKTVIVKLDGRMAMVVLPASYKIDFSQLQESTGAQSIELASEPEFRDLFPDCEVGAMPPFGNLYGLDTYVADTLAEDKEIAFNAGSHTEVIKMSSADYDRLVHPRVMHFSHH